jgi:hypothetical protein
MQQLSIGPGPAATLLVTGSEDNPVPCLIQNVDASNVLYIGDDVGTSPSVPTTCAPLIPGQSTVASGDKNVFGIAAPGQTVFVNIYVGVMSFFQPVKTVIGAVFLAGSGGGNQWQAAKPSVPGFYLYADDGVNPPVLAVSISSAPGTDQWGNTWPGGEQIVGLPSMTNVFSVVDTGGNAVATIDGAGNISGQTISAGNLIEGGLDITNDVIGPMPQGIINRGWCGTPPWPSTAIGTTETPLIELDCIIPAGRQARFMVFPATILLSTAPTAPTQYVQHIRYTTDGSTPTTSSPEFPGHGPMVMTIPVSNLLNYTTPFKQILTGAGGSDVQFRALITANLQSGSYKYATYLEATWEDMGASGSQFSNAATILGSGTSGGGSKQTYTKTYVATEFASYYGSDASYGGGANSQRSHNSNCYQGCSSGQLSGTGDQYSFSRFNYGQIATDLGAGVINWVKLRLTNQHFWYNGGGNAVVGWSTYTGAFGSVLVPGGGTHMNTEHYHMNEGATLNRTMGGWLASAITSGFTSIVLGTSDSYTNKTDLNNYGYFAGAGNVNTAAMLTINYTK